MRVIAGTFGGRRIEVPAGRGTRPTADRVREALFSALGPLDGETVLDLFAGSGALGIEALSRGAATADFVERDRRALGVLRANLTSLGLGPPQAVVRPGEALAAVEHASRRGAAYSLVFLDPPYADAPGLGPTLATALAPVLALDARVVCESDRRAALELELPTLFDRRYGDTRLTIHRA